MDNKYIMIVEVNPTNNPNISGVDFDVTAYETQAKQFYLNDRPADWMEIPDPITNEIYYLIQFATEADDIGINITGTELKYNIQNTDGSWGALVDITSGTDTLISFSYDSNRSITSDGKCQYLIKITGATITTFRHCASTYHPAYYVQIGLSRAFFMHNVVELKINAPFVSWLSLNIPVLIYISFYSSMGNIVNNTLGSYCVGIFSGSTALKCIVGFKAPNATQLSSLFNASTPIGAFHYCGNLKYIDVGLNPLIFKQSMGLFSRCSNLLNYDIFGGAPYNFSGSQYSAFSMIAKLKEFNQDGKYSFATSSSFYTTFYNDPVLKKVNLINTPVCTSYHQAFCYCYLLDEVLGINLSVCTDALDIFTGCYCLRRLVFAPNQDPAPNCSFDISSSYAFTRSGLLELFDSLPECTTSRTITLGTRSAGASELTTEDIAIATAKGWTINI